MTTCVRNPTEVLPYCSPAMTLPSDSTSSSNNKPIPDIMFPVSGYRLEDLYDWSRRGNPNETAPSPSAHRQGTLTTVNGVTLALFRHGSRVYAVNSKCPHAGGPLHLGDIEDMATVGSPCLLRCPWHRWRFDLDTGRVVHPAHRKDVTLGVYPVKLGAGGVLYVRFSEFSPDVFTSMDF